MRLLLDTHALIWSATSPSRIPRQTLDILRDAEHVFVSPVSAYEMTFKHMAGKLPIARRLLADLKAYLERQGYATLPISLHHAEVAGQLPLDHRDPFDRLLAAQALTDDLALVSNDALLDRFGVRRLW